MESRILKNFDFSTFDQKDYLARYYNYMGKRDLYIAQECVGYETPKLKLTEIADRHNLSTERVRQILIKFERKTKYYTNSV